MAIMSLGGPVGCAIGMFTADKFSRKWYTAVLAIISAALGYIYAYQTNINAILVVGFVLLMSMYAYNSVGFGTYVSEIFPTRVRLRATGFANAVGRVFTIISPYWVVFVLNNYGAKLVFITVTVVFVIVAVLVMTMGVETKNKTLEEIVEKAPESAEMHV
jgi:putative MFS transporter